MTTPPRLTEHIQAAALGPPETTGPPGGNFLKPGRPVWRRLYRLAEAFVAFQGHFPGRPVLPALAQTLLAKDMARALRPELDLIAAIVSAKFIRLVEPPAEVAVYAQPPAEGPGPGQWRFQLAAADPAGGPETGVALLRLELR
ncbi:MAG: hypothetical protein LBV21_03950 [Candidatus Adiutrix sp.]|jgi:3-hydroxyacyl-[acyl-carrier-protein] dehydratase|nr:hypothetical protein [Candidatus Adiutrix sp.]